jgi:hypothetical protein
MQAFAIGLVLKDKDGAFIVVRILPVASPALHSARSGARQAAWLPCLVTARDAAGGRSLSRPPQCRVFVIEVARHGLLRDATFSLWGSDGPCEPRRRSEGAPAWRALAGVGHALNRAARVCRQGSPVDVANERVRVNSCAPRSLDPLAVADLECLALTGVVQHGQTRPRSRLAARQVPDEDDGGEEEDQEQQPAVREGDILLRVDGREVYGLEPWELEEQLRGTPGSLATLLFRRNIRTAYDPGAEPLEFELAVQRRESVRERAISMASRIPVPAAADGADGSPARASPGRRSPPPGSAEPRVAPNSHRVLRSPWGGSDAGGGTARERGSNGVQEGSVVPSAEGSAGGNGSGSARSYRGLGDFLVTLTRKQQPEAEQWVGSWRAGGSAGGGRGSVGGGATPEARGAGAGGSADLGAGAGERGAAPVSCEELVKAGPREGAPAAGPASPSAWQPLRSPSVSLFKGLLPDDAAPAAPSPRPPGVRGTPRPEAKAKLASELEALLAGLEAPPDPPPPRACANSVSHRARGGWVRKAHGRAGR